jgi:hypothetical protein
LPRLVQQKLGYLPKTDPTWAGSSEHVLLFHP